MPTIALAPVHNKLLHSWRMQGSAVAVPHTGDLVETELARVAFSAAALGPNGILQVMTLWSATNNANSKTFRVRLGQAAFAIGLTSLVWSVGFTTQQSYQALNIIRNRNDQAQQIDGLVGPQTATAALAHTVVDTSAAFDLVLTGQLANAADTITLEAWQAALFYGA